MLDSKLVSSLEGSYVPCSAMVSTQNMQCFSLLTGYQQKLSCWTGHSWPR